MSCYIQVNQAAPVDSRTLSSAVPELSSPDYTPPDIPRHQSLLVSRLSLLMYSHIFNINKNISQDYLIWPNADTLAGCYVIGLTTSLYLFVSSLYPLSTRHTLIARNTD